MLQSRFSSLTLKLVSVVTAGALATSLVAPAAWAQAAAGQPAKSETKSEAPAAKPKPDKKTKDQARAAFEKGQKAFKAGNFADAAEAFQTANSVLPTPHAEYWIAMSLASQDAKLDEAVRSLEAFLSNPDKDKVGAEKTSEATAKLAELKAKQAGELQLTTEPAGATVTVDGIAQAGVTPLTLKLAPGKHQIDVSANDYKSQVIEVETVAGQKAETKLTLETLLPASPPIAPAPILPEPAPPGPLPNAPPSSTPAEERSMVPAYVTLGLAGAGLVVGSIFGAQALSAKSDFNDSPSSKKADDVERNALIADMAFGVAVTLGLTGIVLLTSPDEQQEAGATASTRLELTPYVHTKGGGAAARLTF